MTEMECKGPCPACGEPVIRHAWEKPKKWLARKSCGARLCHNKMLSLSQRGRAGFTEHLTGWPRVTGELDYANGFAAADITPNDGYVARMQGPESNRTLGGIAPW